MHPGIIPLADILIFRFKKKCSRLLVEFNFDQERHVNDSILKAEYKTYVCTQREFRGSTSIGVTCKLHRAQIIRLALITLYTVK